MTETARISDERRALIQRAARMFSSVTSEWTNAAGRINSDRHSLKTQRLRATWPQLASALDGLADTTSQLGFGDQPPCPHLGCGVPVHVVKASPNPRTGEHIFTLLPCGDEVTRDQALELHNAGADVDVTPINGSTLGAAERVRQVAEEGYDIDHDLAHGSGDLAWAAWSYLDAASGDGEPPEHPPAMWPWPAEAWRPAKSRLRNLVIVIALLQAEVDLGLARGERL